MASPLYPGYYPGKPVYRDRRPWNKPEETELGGFEQSLNDAADKVAESPLNFPRWLIEQEKKDIKSAFNIFAPDRDPFAEKESKKTSDIDYDTMDETEVAFGSDEIEEVPGATVSISLNPKDLAEDPVGALKKAFIDKPLESIRNPDEYATIARAQILHEMTKKPGNPFDMTVKDDPYLQRVSDNAARNEVAKNYQNFTENIVGEEGFMMKSSSSFFRNGAFQKVNTSLHSTLASEFKVHDYDEAAGTLKGVSLDSRQRGYVDKIIKRDDLFNAYSNGGASTGFGEGDFGLKDSFKGLSEKLQTGPFKTFEYDKRTFDTRLKKFKDYDAVGMAQQFNYSLDSTINAVGRLSASDKAISDSFRSYLEGLKSGLGSYVEFDAAGNVVDILNPTGLSKFLRIQGAKLSRNTIDGGIYGNMVRKMGLEISHSKDLRKMFATVKDADGKRVMSEASVNSLNLGRRAHDEWDYASVADMLTDISEGRIPYQFLWQRLIKPRIEQYTPSYWIRQAKDWFLKETRAGAVVQSALFKYQKLLTGLQENVLKGVIGKFILAGKKRWELVKEVIAEAITKAIELGTEGIGLLFDRIIKVVVRFVVNKVIDAAEKIWRAFVKLDFEAVEELLFKFGKVLMPLAVGCFAPFLIGLVGLLFFIAIFVGVLPKEDATKEPGPIGELILETLPWFGGFRAQDCPLNDVLNLSFENDSRSIAAVEAYNLVSGLQRGFWCYWNHHASYDDAADRLDLWDELMFEFNAFPAALNECADCLFWCTWLPYVAYQNVGLDFDPSVSFLGAKRMNDEFKANRTYVEPDSQGACGAIQDGDIVFWNVSAGTGWHVSMVYKVEDEVVYTIHSNAPYKELPLNCNSNGSIQDPPGGAIGVVGFGRP